MYAESLYWPSVWVQCIEGFDTAHSAVYTIHGAQEPPTLIPCQYTRCWRVWNNPYCCFNKQLLFDAVLLFFDMTSDLIMYLFTCHTDYNYYVIFSKSMLQYDMMRELSTLCYNDINIHIYCGKLKEFWSSQGTLTMISL